MRTTNEKGWETLPGETGSLCTSECRVFLFYLDSCFKSFRVLLDVFRLFAFCFPLLSRIALCSVVGSIPGRELIYQFQNKIVLRSECRAVLHISAKRDSFFHKTAGFNPGYVRTAKPGPI